MVLHAGASGVGGIEDSFDEVLKCELEGLRLRLSTQFSLAVGRSNEALESGSTDEKIAGAQEQHVLCCSKHAVQGDEADGIAFSTWIEPEHCEPPASKTATAIIPAEDCLGDRSLAVRTGLIKESVCDSSGGRAVENWSYFLYCLGFGQDSGYIPMPRDHGLDLEIRAHWACTSVSEHQRISASIGDTGEQHLGTDSKRGLRFGDVLVDVHRPLLQSMILHPYGTPRMVWSFLTMAVVLWEVITIPLQMFDLGTVSGVIEMIGTTGSFYWLLDIIASGLTGIERKGYIELRPCVVFRSYLLGWFIIDIFLVVVDFAVIIAMHSDTTNLQFVARISKNGRAVRIFRFIRLVRLARARKALLSFDTLTEHLMSPAGQIAIRLLRILLIILIINHWVACLWYAIAWQSTAERSWTDKFEKHDDLSLYMAALHWSFTQFSPATQDIAASNVGERAFAVAVIIVAMALLSSFMSSMSGYATEMRALNHARLTLESQLRNFFITRSISKELASRIRSFVLSSSDKYRRLQHEADFPMLKQMPIRLQVRLHDELYMPVITSASVFNLFYRQDRTFLVKVCNCAFREHSVPRKFDIFLDDTKSTHAIFTVSGLMTYAQSSSTIYERMHAMKFMNANGRSSLRKSNLVTAQRSSARSAPSPTEVQATVESHEWIAEMTLWSEWVHCGMLMSETVADMILMDPDMFFDVCVSHGGKAALLLQRIAVLAVHFAKDVERCDGKLSDLGMSDEVWADIFFRARRLAKMDTPEVGSAASGALYAVQP